jgi:hypothetical protein
MTFRGFAKPGNLTKQPTPFGRSGFGEPTVTVTRLRGARPFEAKMVVFAIGVLGMTAV